tara:strand:+ start:229 stop:393 length:165 start_codon:yes stop_codon:yes gene_type:complete
MNELNDKQKLLIHLNEVKQLLDTCTSLDDELIGIYNNFNGIIMDDLLRPMMDTQ